MTCHTLRGCTSKQRCNPANCKSRKTQNNYNYMRSKSGHSAMAPCCVQEKIVVHSASIENRKVPYSRKRRMEYQTWVKMMTGFYCPLNTPLYVYYREIKILQTLHKTLHFLRISLIIHALHCVGFEAKILHKPCTEPYMGTKSQRD